MKSRRGFLAGASALALAGSAHAQVFRPGFAPGFRAGLSLMRTASSYVGAIASCAQVVNNNYASGGYVYTMSRTRFRAAIDITTATQLKVVLPTWYCSSSTSGVETTTNGATFRASIESAGGVILGQVTWSGATSVAAPGNANTVSDPVPLSAQINAGTFFFVRVKVVGSTGFPFASGANNNAQDFSNGECSQYSNSDVPDTTMTGGAFGSLNGNIFRPSAVIGLTTLPSVFLLGDSRCTGLQDSHTDSSGDMGEIARGLGVANLAYINAGVAGDRAAWFLASHARRMELAAYCSHVIMETGINDFGDASASDATLRTTMNSLRALFPASVPVFMSTLTPETNSTDSWATTANQTARSPLVLGTGRRETHNDWRRSVPSGFAGCFDVADVAEPSRNAGTWKANGTANYYTPDGIHGNYLFNTVVRDSGAIVTSMITR